MRSEWPGFRNSSAGAAVIRFVLTPFVLFVILVVWALVQNDMYPKEALILEASGFCCSPERFSCQA